MLEVLEVSCRKNDGWLGTLSVGPLRYGTIDGHAITVADFVERCRGKRVLVFAHGYHNREAQADKTIATVAAQMERTSLPYDVVVLFSWAGGLTYAGFGLAVARTKTCGASLSDMLRLLAAVTTETDLCSHSLGAGVVAEALLVMKTIGAGMLRQLGAWIVLAGAIPNNSLSKDGRFDADMLGIPKILVLYSGRDSVLKTAYRYGSFFKTALGLTGPVGWRGMSISQIDVTQSVGSHSEAYSAPAVYSYWAAFKSGLL